MKHQFSTAHWSELSGGKVMPIYAYEPDPNSSHDDFYYNSTKNILYKLVVVKDNKTSSKVWKEV